MKFNTIPEGRHRACLANKLLRVMKLTTFFILLTILNCSAGAFSQQVTLKATNTPLSKVLKSINRQTGYLFFYDSKDIRNKTVSVTIQGLPLKAALNECLGNQNLSYQIINNTVFLQQSDEQKFSGEAKAPPMQVSGQVLDEKGAPLAGVTVRLKDGTTGVFTGNDGKFSITVPQANAVLVFSFIGFVTKEVTAEGSYLNVQMSILQDKLNEVVVVGYGTVKKSDLTGVVASLSDVEISKSTTGNFVLALEGKVSGVNVQQNSGNPGGVANITIRGANSLAGGVNGPIYVVDGLILSGIGNSMDLGDVQSVEVLKDASATAIYGSRGANGVIIITTKRGKAGKNTITYDGYVGVQQVIKKLDLLNASQYKDYYLQSRQNATVNKTIDSSILNSPYDTNWANLVYRNALIQSYTLSVAGGTEQSKYYTSINYFDQEGIVRNTGFSRLAARFNGDQKLADNLQLSNNVLLSYTRNHGLSDESVSNGIAWARPTSNVLDGSGNPTTVSLPYTRTNPVSQLEDIVNNASAYRLVGNLILDYQIVKGLSAKVNIGTDLTLSTADSYTPRALFESSFQGSGSKNYTTAGTWIEENTLNYTGAIGKNHRISAVGGVTFQDSRGNGLGGRATNFIIDGYTYNNLSAGTTQNVSSSYTRSTLLSYLGRVNYGFKDKYLLTLSGRYDGSSRLSEGHKYEFFPSAALAWKVSQEDFLKDVSWLSQLKLRGSWGKTGSQAVSPYSTFSTLGNTPVYLDGSTTGSVGFYPSSVSNTSLHWEETTQTDLGIDLALFNNRLQITSDVYNKTTSGLLLARQTPPSSGYSSSTQNVGKVRNKGFELFVTTENIRGKLNWSTAINFSLNRAKVLDLGKTPDGNPVTSIYTNESSGYFPITLGQVPYAPFGYFVDHVDKNTGQYVFKDIVKDGSIDASDKSIIGNFQPDFIFGFNNDVSYKNFDLSVFLQGSVGNDVWVDAYRYSLSLNGNNNILASVYNGIGTKYPIPNADYGYSGGPSQSSTALIFSGTYVRVKTITLGYTLKNAFGRNKAGSVRFYVTGSNLFTMDKNYPWYDPEVSAGADVVTGWDRGGYTNNKSVVFGIKATL